MKKLVATLATSALLGLSMNCSAEYMDPALEDLQCEGYQDACSICNLAPHWAMLGLGAVAVIGVIVKNSACDSAHHHGHFHN